jgi:NAD(P)-dependent dehydrogenase (short-subunit alcohol dehydrogenase family)
MSRSKHTKKKSGKSKKPRVIKANRKSAPGTRAPKVKIPVYTTENPKKTAIVTGGIKGIGLAYVKALLKRGIWVSIFDKEMDVAVLDKLTEDYGDIVEGYEVDVSNKEQFYEAYEEAKNDMIGDDENNKVIDIIVLNAGIYGFLFDKTEEVIQTNLMHSIRGTEMVLKDVTNGLKGPAPKDVLIAITTSTNGLIPADSDFAPVYVASKFALNGFVKSMKPFASRFNVRVNAIAPVSVRTPMVESLGINDETINFLNSENRGGIMEPELVAEGLLKLIDDKTLAGNIITIHPNNEKGGRIVNDDESLDYLGIWSESKSAAVRSFVDQAIQAVRDDPDQSVGWSKTIENNNDDGAKEEE